MSDQDEGPRWGSYHERRQWARKLRDYMDGPNAGICPVCYTNTESLIEDYNRKIERLRGALMMIAGQENTKVYLEDGPTIVLDSDDKMRQIARQALKNEGWDNNEQ